MMAAPVVKYHEPPSTSMVSDMDVSAPGVATKRATLAVPPPADEGPKERVSFSDYLSQAAPRAAADAGSVAPTEPVATTLGAQPGGQVGSVPDLLPRRSLDGAPRRVRLVSDTTTAPHRGQRLVVPMEGVVSDAAVPSSGAAGATGGSPHIGKVMMGGGQAAGAPNGSSRFSATGPGGGSSRFSATGPIGTGNGGGGGGGGSVGGVPTPPDKATSLAAKLGNANPSSRARISTRCLAITGIFFFFPLVTVLL